MSSPPTEPSGDATRPGNLRTGILRWLGVLRHHPWISIVVLLAVGGTSVATLDATDYYFTSDNFCAFQCHVMEIPYKELQQSKHWNTPSGVVPTSRARRSVSLVVGTPRRARGPPVDDRDGPGSGPGQALRRT